MLQPYDLTATYSNISACLQVFRQIQHRECEVQHRAYSNTVTMAYEGNHVNRERAAGTVLGPYTNLRWMHILSEALAPL